jgi:hypothetical protein
MIFHRLAKKYQDDERIKIYILTGLIILVLFSYFVAKRADFFNQLKPVEYGVTFCQGYAKALGFDPHKLYLQIFQDLKIKNIRLSAYWDEIELKPNEYNFTDLDFYINTASKNDADIILAIGYKLPRWPECRVPKWLEGSSIKYRQERQLQMLSQILDYYTNFNPNPKIKAFQIENEPFLSFGTCDPVDEAFFKKEIELVRSKTDKPIILTDSGELSSWINTMRLSDYFGTTMYRTVRNPIVGAMPYPLQPWFYRFKSDIVRKIFAPNNIATINVELQAEPWAHVFIAEMPIDEQIKYFSPSDFQKNIEFAGKTGFPETYLWGVEWWYYIKNQGYPEYLDFAKTLFN